MLAVVVVCVIVVIMMIMVILVVLMRWPGPQHPSGGGGRLGVIVLFPRRQHRHADQTDCAKP